MPRPAVLIAGAIAVLAALVGVVRYLSNIETEARPEEFRRLTHDNMTINIEGDAFGLSKSGVPQASGRVRFEHNTLTLVFDQSNTRIAAIGSEIACSVVTSELLTVECVPSMTAFPTVWAAHLD